MGGGKYEYNYGIHAFGTQPVFQSGNTPPAFRSFRKHTCHSTKVNLNIKCLGFEEKFERHGTMEVNAFRKKANNLAFREKNLYSEI